MPTTFGLSPTGTGVLDGRSFVAKDFFALRDHTSSFGSARWRDTHEPSGSTAVVIERLLAAGAELVGLTKLDSLAYSMLGNAAEGTPPRNARYPDRFTGGSSSGSAAAVAGGLTDLGLGSDTGGSIRGPAAACGLCSIRPTHGTIDMQGVLPLAPSFDTVGLLARDPALLRDAHAVLLGADRAADAPVPVTEVLLAVDTLEWLDPDAANAVAHAGSQFASRLGCPLRYTDVRAFTSPDAARRLARLLSRELWSRHGDWVEANLDCFIDDVSARLLRARQAATASEEEQAADLDAWESYRNAFAQLFGPGTCLVMPVLHGLPPSRAAPGAELDAFQNSAFRLATPCSLTGAPEAVVPVHHEESGNTYGVGLVGARGADRALLGAAVRAFGDGWPTV